MNNNGGALEFDAVIQNTDFKREIDEMNARIKTLVSQTHTETQKMDADFKRLGAGIAAVFTMDKARQFVSDIIRVRGEFQQLDIALTTMLHSKTKADKLMSELVDFAANTPFGLKEVAGATKQLLAYGSTAESITGELRMLGDLAAGVSQPIGELIYLYGTLRTQGRAYAVDIRQFAGRGIPIYQELAKVLKIAESEVAAYVEAGKVGFPEVQKALQNMTAAGSQFGGLMEAQSKSIPGQIERLGDAWDQMLNKIGTSMQPAIEGGIAGLSTLVEHYDEIGRIMGGIIITYGSYKAAVIAVNALNKMSAVTAGEVATAEAVAARSKADNAISSANLAKSLATELAAKSAAAQATLNEARATVSAAAAKKAAAIETARGAAADIAAAEAKLASALAAQSSANAYTTASAKEVLAKNVSIARTELQVATENGLIARKAAAAAASEFNAAKIGVETAAKTANTVSTAANTAATNANTAATAANVAATNAETIATGRATALQQLKIVAVRQLTAAQALLNRTMLANPYVAVTVGLVALGATLWALHDSTSAQERAQETLNKKMEEGKNAKDEYEGKVNSLISKIKDETNTIYQQIAAYEELKQLLPQISGKSIEDIKNMSGGEVKQLFDIKNAQDINSELEKTKAILEGLRKERSTMNTEVFAEARAAGLVRDSMKATYEEAIAGAEGHIKNLEFQIQLIKQAQEEEKIKLLPLDQQRAHYQQIVDELQLQKSAIEASNKSLIGMTVQGGVLGNVLSSLNINPLANQLDYYLSKLKEVTPTVAGQSTLGEIENAISKLREEQKKAKNHKEWLEIEKQITAEIAKQNAITGGPKKRESKPSKLDVELPAGSLAEFDRQIQKAQEVLSKIPADEVKRIEAMHDTILRLTQQRAEAAKIVEFKTWDETLQYKRQQYEEYAAAVGAINGEIFTGDDVIVSEVAKSKYANLLKEGENYYQFLKNQLAPLEEKMQSGNLTDVESAQFLTLNNALRTLKGESSPMELFKESLDKVKDSSGNTAQYVSYLRDEIAALDAMPDSQKDDLYWAKKNELTQQYREGIRATAQELKTFLQQVKGSEEKRKEIEDYYAGLREQAQNEGRDTYLIDEAEREELSAWALEANEAVRKLNTTIYDLATREGLKKYAEDTKKAYESMRNNAKYTAQQIEAARIEAREAADRLSDFDTQQWQSWLSLLADASDEFAGMEGTMGAIAQLLTSAVSSSGNLVQNLSKAFDNKGQELTAGEKAGNWATAISGGISLIAGVFSARKRRKEKERALQVETLEMQLAYNMALNEEIRLRTALSENVYFKDYAGRVRDSIEAATDAVQKYNLALTALMVSGKAINGQKNKVDWGAVGGAAGTGAATGAAIGAIAGGGVLSPVATAVGAVVGAVVGGIVGLVGMMKKADIFGPLLEKYPMLIDANGELNKSLAESLLATNLLDDQTKVLMRNAIEAYEAIQEAQQQITDIVSELTGNLGTELRDALVGAFSDGTDAAEAFASVVEKTLNNALSNLIFSAVFSRAFDKLQKDLEGSLWGSGKSFQEVFAAFMSQSDELTRQFNEAMKAAQDAGKTYGFDLFNPADSARAGGLSGIGQSITEDTGSLLLGQANAMRMTMAVNNELVQESIFNLLKIESNTRHLVEIRAILARMERSGGADYARASGITF